MQALVLNANGEYAVEDRPMPEPGPGEVLLRTRYSGICGTDLHAPQLGVYRGDVVIGHEFAGEVAAVGPGVDEWREGDRAAVHPKGNVCGRCSECRAGMPNLCSSPDIGGTAGIASDGGMAAYAALPAGKLRRLPDEVSMLEGAWVEPIAVALRGVTRSGFAVGRRAAVLGAGPIGLLTTMHLRLAGASDVTVLEPSEARRDMALQVGADRAIDPVAEDPAAIFGSDLPLADFAFECSGASAALDAAVSVVRPHGGLALVGVAMGAVAFHSWAAIRKELHIVGSSSYAEEFDIAIGLLARKALDVLPLTTDVVPLDAYEDAFQRLTRGSAIKILAQPNE